MTRAAFLIIAVLFIAAVPPTEAREERAVELVSSSEDGVILRYESGRLSTRVLRIGDREYTGVTIDGADVASVPGAPALPVVRVRVAIPDCERVNFRVSVDGTVTESGVRVVPSPSVLSVEGGGLSEYVYVEGGPYREEGLWPREAATMSGPRWTTTQRTVAVAIYPCQTNPQEELLLSHRSIEVALTFQGIKRQSPRSSDLPRRERMLESLLANYESGRAWRRGRVERRVPGRDDYFTTSSNWVKLTLEETGLYRVDHGDLAAVGVDADLIDPGTVRVFSGGGISLPALVGDPRPTWMEECAVDVEGDGDGTFDPGDGVVFYGLDVDGWVDELGIDGANEPFHENRYANDNVYWLTWENEGTPSGFTDPPRRMAEDDLQSSPTPIPAADYRARAHLEGNVFEFEGRGDSWYWLQMQSDRIPESDYFHAEQIVADFGEFVHGHFSHIVTDSTGLLRVRVDGNSSEGGHPDHRTEFTLNGTLAHVAEWDGYSRYVFEEDGLPMRTEPQYNTLEIHVPRADPLTERDHILIDWYELEYWRELSAVDAQLRFGSSGRTGIVEYSVDGFDGTAGAAYKVIDKFTLRTVPGVTLTDGRLTFQDEVADTAAYVVVSDVGHMRPTIEVDDFGDLRPPGSADYMIIAHDDFHDAGARLKSHRQSSSGGGFSVQLVRLSDVYDEFSWGVVDPTAIRNYLMHVWDSWDVPPTHVLLLGDASSDYRQYQATSSPCLVPTYYTGALHWPTDLWFVGFEDYEYDPAMALGRLPVTTAGEAATMIDKIEHYDTELEPGLWKNTVMLVADDEFKGLDGDGQPIGNPEYYHTVQAEMIDDLVLPWPIDRRKIFLMEYDHDAVGNKAGARADIVEAWNDGALVMNYTGHGNELLMAHENVFLFDDIPRLHNIDRLPLFFAASCRLNKFDQRTGDSLGEALAKSPIGGTIASIGSTRDSGAGQNSELNRSFLKYVFGHQQVDPAAVLDIGQAFQNGFITTAIDHSDWLNNTRFILVGDPAVTTMGFCPSSDGTPSRSRERTPARRRGSEEWQSSGSQTAPTRAATTRNGRSTRPRTSTTTFRAKRSSWDRFRSRAANSRGSSSSQLSRARVVTAGSGATSTTGTLTGRSRSRTSRSPTASTSPMPRGRRSTSHSTAAARRCFRGANSL